MKNPRVGLAGKRRQAWLGLPLQNPQIWHLAHFGSCLKPRAQLQVTAPSFCHEHQRWIRFEYNRRFATAHQRRMTVMLKKSHFPSLKLLSLQLENKQRKFYPFLPLLKFGKQRQTQIKVFSWSPWPDFAPQEVFPGWGKLEFTSTVWLEFPEKSSPHPLLVYHRKQQALLTHLT